MQTCSCFPCIVKLLDLMDMFFIITANRLNHGGLAFFLPHLLRKFELQIPGPEP
ncbi:hypothetical protein ACJX0J_041336, partial [Zea mays]